MAPLDWQNLWSRSLKAKLLVLVLGVLVSGIWLVAQQAVSQMREEMQRGLGDRLATDTSLLADDIEREVNNRKWALEQVASVLAPALAANDAKTLQNLLDSRPVFNSNFNRGTFGVGTNGVALASTPQELGRAGINYAERDYMIAALQSGETFIGSPVMGKPSGTPVLAIAAPARIQGRIVGALVGVTDVGKSSFLSRLKDFAAEGGREVTLLDVRSRLVVASSNPARIMQVVSLPEADLASNGISQRGDRLSAVRPVGTTGWLVMASSPLTTAYAAAEKMQGHIVSTAITVTLVAVLLTLGALRILMRPLARSSWQLSHWIGHGAPFTPDLTARSDEIGHLTHRFNLVTEQLQAQRQTLEQSSALMEKAGALAHVGGWELDVRTQKLFWSLETCRIHELDECVAPSLEAAINFYAPHSKVIVMAAVKEAAENGTPYDLELELVTAKGNAIWVQSQCHAVVENGQVTKLRGAFQDITRSKADAGRISVLAFSDALTGLPNRRLMIDRLDVAMASSKRHVRHCALLVVDLDNFKLLNDSYGHFKGDLLLKEVAQDMVATVREVDTVARVGADEFMILVTDLSGDLDDAVQQAKAVSAKLLLALRRNYLLGRLHYYSTASIGVTLFGSVQESPEEPMKRADLAMVQARNSGGNTMRFFEPRMQAMIERRVELEAAMRQGLVNNEFVLYYQPQVVEHFDGQRRVVGAEALIRWKHPDQGMISPADFIPVAEESGLILHLGQWVLSTACAQLNQWSAQPQFAHLSIAVNVSARQFHQPDFVATVLETLTTSGADPKRLKLELTEGLLVSNLEDVVVKMNSLKTLGVSFSLDDFGTGYSSLSYLKRLPLDQLKIDKSFVNDILNDSSDAAIARTVIALADSLGLSIIAEGVETHEQRRFLAGEGCVAYQGYVFSRPLPVEEFECLVQPLRMIRTPDQLDAQAA